MKKVIIVSTATGKQVPAIDVCGEKHWEPLEWRTACKVLATMNREVGGKAYRLESL